MPGKRQHIHVHLLHMNIQHSGTLGSIHEQYSPFLLRQFSYLIKWNNGTKQIGTMTAYNKPSIRTKSSLDSFQIKLTFLIHGNIVYLYPRVRFKYSSGLRTELCSIIVAMT